MAEVELDNDTSAATTSVAAQQPTANWQYEALSRKSAEVATALAANKLAGILAGHLRARGIIGQPVFDQATNYAVGVTEYARVEHLVTAVLTKTKYNPQCYHDFIEALELDGIRPDTEAACSLLPAAPTTTSSSGREGSQSAKVVSAGELSTSAVSLLSESTPGSDSASGHKASVRKDRRDTSGMFPYLNVRKLSERDMFALQSRLLKDSDDIILEFSDLKHHTINSLASRGTPVKELYNRLSSLGAYRPTRKPVPFLRNQLEEIERAEDVEAVFCILDKYYSFFNYVIIKKVVNWFGTPEDKERLDTYTEHFKRFCKRRTFECPANIFRPADKGETVLVVKFEESWDPTEGCSLENILRLSNSLAEILEVEPVTLHLRQIDQGCVELQFQVPSFVEEDIFPLTVEQEKSLASVGVTRLTCGSYRFSQPLEGTMAQGDTPIVLKHGQILARGYKLGMDGEKSLDAERVFILDPDCPNADHQLRVFSYPLGPNQLQEPLCFGGLQAWKLVTSQTHDAVSIVCKNGNKINLYFGYRAVGDPVNLEIRHASSDFEDVENTTSSFGWTITDATGSEIDCGGSIPMWVKSGEGQLRRKDCRGKCDVTKAIY